MSTQSGTATEKLPRKLKKKLKHEAAKVNPAGSPSKLSREILAPPTLPLPARPRAKEPHPSQTPESVRAHAASPKLLARIGRSLEAEHGDLYRMVCDQRYDLYTLVAVIVEASSFRLTLAKYRTHQPHRLMKQVAEYLRAQKEAELREAEKEDAADSPAPTKRGGPTAAQKAQSERDKAAARHRVRLVHTAKQQSRKPRSATVRATLTDHMIVKKRLDECFQQDPELRALFCRASEQGLQRLLRTNRKVGRISRHVQSELAKPSRVIQVVRTTVRELVREYRAQDEAAKQQADEVAAQRRANERQRATEESNARVQAISRKQNPGLSRSLRKEIRRSA